MAVAETIRKVERLGARPYNRHVTFKDVPKLRQFIKLRPSKQFPEPGQPRIIVHCQSSAAIHSPAFVEFAKFVQAKMPAVRSHTQLREDDWAAPVHQYGRGDKSQERGEDDKAGSSNEHVNSPRRCEASINPLRSEQRGKPR
jgi:hypothetical protein